MAVPVKSPGVSWLGVLLLTGLSILSWLSTYTGIMELISASSGEPATEARIGVAFAVFMLQAMTLYLLDAMFSGRLRWWLYPVYTAGYALLFLIAVGFAFGFYWKYLEAGNAATASTETSFGSVQQTLQLGTARLEQLQATLASLATLSAQKAEQEKATGGTCGGGGNGARAGTVPVTGDGPRRRLRDADAQRFQYASSFIGRRTGEMKAELAALSGDLQRLAQRDVTGAIPPRTSMTAEVNRRMATLATRFNALGTDPQLRQLRDDLRQRSVQTGFPDDRGGTFTCADPQLQTALNGVVRAFSELPEMTPPTLHAYEGASAVMEAFRRLTASGIATTKGIAAGLQDNIVAATGLIQPAAPVPPAIGGLSERDTIPLGIAFFVDFCILLVSVNRPFGRVVRALTAMKQAEDSRLIEVLMPVYRVFINNFNPRFRPTPEEVVAPLVDIVIDHKGRYYAAAPLDYREHSSSQWMEARAERARDFGDRYAFDRPQERSRYISSALVILQGQQFIQLMPRRRALTDKVIRAKLARQGSLYAEAESFRLYAFAQGAWPEFLHAVLGSAAGEQMRAEKRAAREREREAATLEAARERIHHLGRRKDRRMIEVEPAAPPRIERRPQPAQIEAPQWVARGALKPVDGKHGEETPHRHAGFAEAPATPFRGAPLSSTAPVHAIAEGVDPDPSDEHFSSVKFKEPPVTERKSAEVIRLPRR